MRTGFLALVIAIAVAAVVAYNSMFTVPHTQQALVLQFGEIKDVVEEPGLHFKVPFIQNAVYFDKRILDLDTPALEIIAAEQKRLVVDAFARYRITNPVRFFQAVNSIEAANSRLATILNSATRRVLGESTFEQIVRDVRPQLMARISQQLNAEAQSFGITVVDVRIRRADLPEQNSQAIFQRMQTERQQEAAQIRAEGEEAARRIRANADREVVVLVAEAERESQQIRGQGDAERTQIFASAYGRDADFFSFYRSMQAYEAGLNGDDTQLVLSPDTDFFRFFSTPTGVLRAELPGTQQQQPDEDGTPPSISSFGQGPDSQGAGPEAGAEAGEGEETADEGAGLTTGTAGPLGGVPAPR